MRTCKNSLPSVASILEATQEEKYIIRLNIGEDMTLYENPLGWVFDKKNATGYNLETIERRINEVDKTISYGILDYIRG